MSFQNKTQSGEREEEAVRGNAQKAKTGALPQEEDHRGRTPTEESFSSHQSHVTDEGTTGIKREACESERRKEKHSRTRTYGSLN